VGEKASRPSVEIWKRLGLPDEYKRYIEKAGFVDVKEVHHNWLINTWPAV
jgi:hypothetical protein